MGFLKFVFYFSHQKFVLLHPQGTGAGEAVVSMLFVTEGKVCVNVGQVTSVTLTTSVCPVSQRLLHSIHVHVYLSSLFSLFISIVLPDVS